MDTDNQITRAEWMIDGFHSILQGFKSIMTSLFGPLKSESVSEEEDEYTIIEWNGFKQDSKNIQSDFDKIIDNN